MAKNRRLNGGDIVAIILACTLGIALLVTTVAVMVFGHKLDETGGRLLTTIGAGLVGALGVYVGRAVKNGHKSDDEDDE